MRLATANVKVIEPSVLQSIDDALRSNSHVEVIDVFDSVLTPPQNDVSEMVAYIIAPSDGLYTPPELNDFMGNLNPLPDLPFGQDRNISFRYNGFRESAGKNQHTGPKSLVFGNLFFRERIGKRIITYVPEDAHFRREHRANFNEDGVLSLEEDMYRSIHVHPFPNAQYARDVLPQNPFDIRPQDANKIQEALGKRITFFGVPYKTLEAYMPKQTPKST